MVCAIGTGIVACTGGTIPEASITQPDRPVPSSGRDEYGSTAIDATDCANIPENLIFTTGLDDQQPIELRGGGEAWFTNSTASGVFFWSNYVAPAVTTPDGYPSYKPWSFRGELRDAETGESMGIQLAPAVPWGLQTVRYYGMINSEVFADAGFTGGDLVCETCRYDIALQWTDTENPACTISANFGDVLLRFPEGRDYKWRKSLPSERPDHHDTSAHTGGPG
jgi:hypothetical protein